MTSYLQLQSATGFDLTVGFEKGAYAVATSIELDASQGRTVDWIQAMPTQEQSFFISAYLPQFTEDFSTEIIAAPTVSTDRSTPYAAVPATASPSASLSIAHRRGLRPSQGALLIRTTSDKDNKMILAIVVTLSFLVLFGGCFVVLYWVRSIRSRSSETSGSLATDRAEINETPSVAATMSETSFRTEPVPFHGTFSNSEAGVPRHPHPSGPRFELGSSISSSSSSSSGGAGLVVDFNSLDDPFSDTAVISSLAREASPALSPSQSTPLLKQMEEGN